MTERDLTLVGLSEDKTRLVLVSDTGEEFTLAADDKLRAALRGDHARLGQLEITMESALRPREIQARIRAGESPESVAAAAQTSLDKVLGYATPVLAERAHIADRAQLASVRRKSGDGASRPLGDAVAEHLRGREVDPETVEWDAWRREDGRWTLVADYRASGGARHAEFVFDAPGRYVVADDDEARRLLGELPAEGARSSRSGSRRLSAVGADEELPLGEDAIELVSEARPAAHADRAAGPAGPADPFAEEPPGDEEATVDLAHTARAVRAARPETAPGEPAGDADWIATQASDRPGPTAGTVPAPGTPSEPDRPSAEDATDPTDPDTDPAEREPETTDPDPTDPDTTDRDTTDADPTDPAERAPEPRKPRKKSGRASVPSWDEIMFGGSKRE